MNCLNAIWIDPQHAGSVSICTSFNFNSKGLKSILIVSLACACFAFCCVFFYAFLKNGTFLAPTLTIPMMMFAGFGVTLRDLPNYMKWGSHVSFMRYGLEGFVGAIYGEGRKTLDCNAIYCHYR